MSISTDTIEAYAQLATAMAAVLAVVVGPLIGFILAKRQMRLGESSQRNHEWTNDLRSEVAELLVEIRKLVAEMKEPNPEERRKSLLGILEAGTRREGKIKMLVDPARKSHMDLINALEALMLYTEDVNNTAEGRANREQDVFESVRAALKEPPY
jgi:hypothetical protein